jgi:beta-galactosidase
LLVSHPGVNNLLKFGSSTYSDLLHMESLSKQILRPLLIIQLLASFTSITLFSQENKIATIQRMGTYNVQSFDDNWQFARFGLQADGTSIPEPQGIEQPGFDDVSWRKLDLPHDWAIEGPFRIDLSGETGKLPFKGIGWYRKSFTLPAEDQGKQVFVDFDGAMAYAEVWLNGNYVGTWPYGYSSFRMNLTPFIKFGEANVMAVRLDTEKWDSRWYPGAGIYRHVWLVKTNPVHVAHWGTFITFPNISQNKATIKIEVEVDNEGPQAVDAIIHTTVYELNDKNIPLNPVAFFPEKKIHLNTGKSSTGTSQVTLDNPKRWDINSPNRYLAHTEILVNDKLVDTYNTPFGVRTIEFTAREGFLLNGKRVAVQGTCNHHDLGALGAAMNTSALRRQLTILKEMGVNALRTSHNPPAPELIELADQMGFLVWDEAFDCWKAGKKDSDYNKLYDEWHSRDLTAMVKRDRNNPSVFIWSIGNEVPDQKNIEMTKELVAIVKAVDPTRPVSNGYNDPDNSRSVGSAMAVDIMGVNYFFNQQPKWDADPRYAKKPTIGSETSSCISSRGEYFFHTDYKNWQIASYDHACPGWGCIPDDQFRVNAKFPHLLGEFVWTGFDYLGEPTPYYSDDIDLKDLRKDPSRKRDLETKLAEIREKTPPSRSSYFGIVDLAGFPKDRFYLYQSQWRPELPMAHILPHWNWSERLDSVVPVYVYTSGDEAELFLNDKSLGRKSKVAGKDFRLGWEDVAYQPGELKVVAYKNGKPWASDSVKTTGEATFLDLSADRRQISSKDDDLAFITLKIVDDEGMLVPRTHSLIKFEIIGPGEIVATDNGDATSFVPFQNHEREAYNGMALAIVKAKPGSAGSFTVKAKANGLGEAIIEISISPDQQ